MEEGALYPALHRLEVRGLLAVGVGRLGQQPAGEVLPADGRGPRQLAQEASYWTRMSAGIARIMETA